MTAHILFVDDEEPNLVVFEAVCGDDFPVLTASSGSAALELMEEHEVGVVLTDQRMPKRSNPSIPMRFVCSSRHTPICKRPKMRSTGGTSAGTCASPGNPRYCGRSCAMQSISTISIRG